MREIEFRAFDKNLKVMINKDTDFENLEEDSNFDCPYFGDEYYPICQASFMFPRIDLDRFKVMQWTGLLDKNGVKIFEDDVIKYYRTPSEFELCQIKYIKSEASFHAKIIKYVNCGGLRLGSLFYNGMCKNVEVIGNIHEHSHLLGNENAN